MEQYINYRGRMIAVKFPSGYFEVGLDNQNGGTQFVVFDDLDDAKAALDKDISLMGF